MLEILFKYNLCWEIFSAKNEEINGLIKNNIFFDNCTCGSKEIVFIGFDTIYKNNVDAEYSKTVT